ncbi:MAG: hypothetical protein QOE13_125 [Gaiellaceae bacterium]|jgi:hypothetical protein|nr:hypothetical protein [Gaiellaceae bacterium]
MDLEKAVFRAFVHPDRKSHYVNRVENPKTREKLLWELDHRLVRDLDPRYAFPIEPGHRNADQIYARLRSRGAPNRCHVMGGGWEMDGKDAPLKEALEHVLGAALISCIPGQLAFYMSDEWESDCWVLERPLRDAIRD